jgi:hypothetical protein
MRRSGRGGLTGLGWLLLICYTQPVFNTSDRISTGVENRLSIIEILHSAGSSFTAFRTQNDIFKSHFYVKEVLDLELG